MKHMQGFFSPWLYVLKRPFHLLKTGLGRGLVGQLRFKFPARKLRIIAVTGTDGKTTSATLIYQVLKQSGKKVALISTVAAFIGDEQIKTGLHVTSPDPFKLHQFLRRMVDEEVEYVVLEVTSHGAYQYRTWGIKPIIAAITNIAAEHLDYHLNMPNYIKAKALMFNKAERVILNADDANFQALSAQLKQQAEKATTYQAQERLNPQVQRAIKQSFPEAYNHLNARLVYKVAQELEIRSADFIQALKNFPGVPGRMQTVEVNQPFRVVVDFAHTPQALEAVLTALKKQLPTKKSRLIAVYGAAGLRDQQKRPIMGQVGTQIADLVIFTAEDPRTEDVWAIIRQLKESLSDNLAKVMSIADRKKAIEFALTKLAQKGDIVAILGKGHEQSMCYGATEYPWSDVEVVKSILTD